jgi:hypothetical protein
MRKAFLLLISLIVVSQVNFQVAVAEESRPECKEVAAVISTDLAKRKSWFRRHPVWSSLGVGTALVTGAAVYVAPIYPFDYSKKRINLGIMRIDIPGRSAAFDQIARSMDKKYYLGSPEHNQKQLEFEQTIPVAVVRPYLGLQTKKEAETSEEKNKNLRTLSPSQESHYDAIANYFGPRIFQDGKDIPLSLFFSGKTDTIHNAKYLENISAAELRPVVYQLVKETESHFFIEYILYYPVQDFSGSAYHIPISIFPDPKSFTHDQDIEIQIVAIAKTADGRGRHDGTLTLRHGYLNIFHTDRVTEKKLRQEYASHFKSPMDVLNIAMGVLYQPHSIRHSTVPTEFVMDPHADANRPASENVAGMYTYSARMGHALMSASRNAWANGFGDGEILVPESSTSVNQNGVISYHLESWQKVLDKYGTDAQVFTNVVSEQIVKTADRTLKIRANLPASIASEQKVETNLPADTAGRTPYSLAFPHAVFTYLYQGIKDAPQFSDVYIYNPDIEEVYKPSN